jgi:hypothetical protein
MGDLLMLVLALICFLFGVVGASLEAVLERRVSWVWGVSVGMAVLIALGVQAGLL